MFIALGVMSVQLLLLRKSIYWTWVYCKITKVKTWISFGSHSFAASPFPCPLPAWCPLYPVPSWWQPIRSQWLLSHRPYLTTYLGSLPLDVSKEETKSPTWKNKPWRQKNKEETAHFLHQDFWLCLWPCHEPQFGMGMQDMAKKRSSWKQP